MKTIHVFWALVLGSFVLTAAWVGEQTAWPEICFESTVCDLGRVGLGSRNTCEFKFTNTGQGLLEITNFKRTLSVS